MTTDDLVLVNAFFHTAATPSIERGVLNHGLNQSSIRNRRKQKSIQGSIDYMYKHFETIIEYVGDISSIREHLGTNLNLPNDAVVKTSLSTATKLCCSEKAPPCRRLKVASWYNVLSQRYSPWNRRDGTLKMQKDISPAYTRE